MNSPENSTSIQCSNCGGFYPPALTSCPHCGASPDDTPTPAAEAPTIADYAGGFGQPGSTLSRVATGIAVALLLLAIGTLIYLGSSIFTRLTGGLTPAKQPDTSAVSSAEASKSEEETPKEVEAKSVTLDTDTITLAVDETYTLTASVKPSEWEGELVWSSDDETVATVDQKGALTNINGGDCTVTVTAGKASAVCKIHCDGQTLAEKKAAEQKKKEEEEAKKKAEEEAKKAEEERKKAEEEEAARKKAEEEQRQKEEEERKKAEEAAQQSGGELDLTLYGNHYPDNDLTLAHIGDGYDFTITGGDGNYTASSSDSSVASVSGTKVVGVGVGTAYITWTSGDGKSVTAIIHVRN